MATATIAGLPHKVVVVEMPGCTTADAPTVVSAQLLDPDGVAYGVPQADGKPRVSAMPYLYDIAEGKVPSHAPFRRFGVNMDVAATWETVTNQSTAQPYLTSAERLKIVSTDADDDGSPVGDGARTLNIKGLDGNYDIISETVTMNGTGVVTTDASFLRPLRACVCSVGLSGVNEGTITIKNNAGAVTLLQVNAEEGQSNSAIWTIPAGKVAYITSWNGAESSNKGALIGLWFRSYGGSWRYARSYVLMASSFFHLFPLPLLMAEKMDIEIRAKGVLAGAVVSAGFDGWYEAV